MHIFVHNLTIWVDADDFSISFDRASKKLSNDTKKSWIHAIFIKKLESINKHILKFYAWCENWPDRKQSHAFVRKKGLKWYKIKFFSKLTIWSNRLERQLMCPLVFLFWISIQLISVAVRIHKFPLWLVGEHRAGSTFGGSAGTGICLKIKKNI